MSSARFSFLGTNVIYNNGQDRDIKTYLGTGFDSDVVDQDDKGGRDLIINS